MAFTEAQRVKIRSYLGFPNVFQYEYPRLENAMDLVGAQVDATTRTEVYLTELDAIDAELTDHTRAGVKEADGDVGLYEPKGSGASSHHRALRSAGRVVIGRLSTMMGIEPASDYFGEGGYTSDGWMHGSPPFGVFRLG